MSNKALLLFFVLGGGYSHIEEMQKKLELGWTGYTTFSNLIRVGSEYLWFEDRFWDAEEAEIPSVKRILHCLRAGPGRLVTLCIKQI